MADDDDEPNWDAIAKMDPTIRRMRYAKIPLNRENYIMERWGKPGTEDHPAEWTDEHEDMLPSPLRRG
jgi:hypothetical protein